MKISLKSTILIICFAIIGVIAYQFYWLNSLYRTSKNEMEVNIRNSMKTADIRELQVRMKILEEDKNKTGSISTSAGFKGTDMDVTETKSSYEVTDSSGLSANSHVTISNDSTSRRDSSASENHGASNSMEIFNNGMMEAMMLNGIHEAIDVLIFPNIQNYDSVLTVILSGYEINNQQFVDLIEVENDSIISSTCLDHSMISRSMVKYEYSFGMKEKYKYRLWIENPNMIILQQMIGILTASLIVLFLLGFLFYYLMHTIWRQKTLEEMKNDFINNMTHEFKTPLSVSYAAVDALLVTEKGNNKEHREKYLNIAKDQINHLAGLVEQILSMSRDSKRNIEMDPEKIALKEMVESIVRQQTLAAKKEIEFDPRIDPDDLMVNFDRMHLANLLNNLIENSIKYSGESVKITLEAHYVNGKDVRISVEDNGIGIDSEKQKNVFDKFYRVPTGDKHNVKGYGLGLFYVKETLERVGGRIEVKSKPGKGSVFTIYIPQN